MQRSAFSVPQLGTSDKGQATGNYLIRSLPLACRLSLVACRLTLIVLCALLATYHTVAEAGLAKGETTLLDAQDSISSGGTARSENYRQQVSLGGGFGTEGTSASEPSLASASSLYRVVPGVLAALISGTTKPLEDLNISVIIAKTEPGLLGVKIPERVWQTDNDPVFDWEPPVNSAEVAGYSYAIDGAPDDVIDTTATLFNVETDMEGALADGQHTFSVKAADGAGNFGDVISFEVWVDTTSPYIVAYTPEPGALFGAAGSIASATVTDLRSGLDPDSIRFLINGKPVAFQFDDENGVVTVTDNDAWVEGSNTLQLDVADRSLRLAAGESGNQLAPSLIWGVTRDTKPPTDLSITINGGAKQTSSIYVTLNLSATDATSGVRYMLITNDGASKPVQELYATVRELWMLLPVTGKRSVSVRFVDKAGNMSEAVSADIDLELFAPETVITSGPNGLTATQTAMFNYMCPAGGCLFSFAFDSDEWSEWSTETSASVSGLTAGNHYFRVKAARETNGVEGIQADEEDPSPAQHMWIVGLERPLLPLPAGPPIKLWRLE